MQDLLSLQPMQVDALREVANIGAGHAATALSQMTGQTIMISVPQINVAPLEEVPPQLGAPEEPVRPRQAGGACFPGCPADLQPPATGLQPAFQKSLMLRYFFGF
jgi:hypothetical protein